jgi:tetratricopeptide (TPR) repeat protein
MANPKVGLSYFHLAMLYLEQARYEEAQPLFLNAVRIWEEVLGPEDLDLAYALTGLAKLFSEQYRYEEAEALFLRVLRMREPFLGLEHPQIAVVHQGLANLARKQGKYEQAEQYYQQALSVQEKSLGQGHADIAETLHDLALLRQSQSNSAEAISLAERALQIRVQTLGEAHPKTIATQALYAQLGQQRTGETSDPQVQGHILESASRSFPNPSHAPFSEDNPLQAFLDACCELHPRAWCRISDLWQAYEHWVGEQQERFPLSRRAFATQVQARGCRTDRTNTARLWRGITLVKHVP